MLCLSKMSLRCFISFFAVTVGFQFILMIPQGLAAPMNSAMQNNLRSSFRDCDNDCPNMITISSGSFQMGKEETEKAQDEIAKFELRNSTPRHLVIIGYEFALGKYDITRAEFSAFVRDSNYQAGKDCTGYATGRGFSLKPSGLDWQNPGFSQTDQDPVVCVNLNDIEAYLAWLSHKTGKHYRLPSEAEWEYAAREGDSNYWDSSSSKACHYANVRDLTFLRAREIKQIQGDYFDCTDHYSFTSPVGTYSPNGLGLYDMLGNVSQLTDDCWILGYVGAPANGTARGPSSCMTHVSRGGSFAEPPRFINASHRGNLPAFIRSDIVGFRVARDL